MVLCLSNTTRCNLESVFPNADVFNTSYAYDANGNLDTLNRYMGGTQIDQLEYQYTSGSNQLLTVTDNGTTEGYTAGTGNYLYDSNGNMYADPAKSTDIEYNHLNLPQKVTFDNTDNVRYIYSAGGSTLRKAIADKLGNISNHFHYSGPFMYESDTLKAIFTSAGRIVPMDDNGEVLYKFEYNLQDHLGNTRVVFGGNDNGRPKLLQTTDYYPFGMTMTQQNYFNADVLANKYLYNGKELQDDDIAGNKLDWYDYGARFYDPALGRWHSVDPLAESMNSWSPYNYGFNNPIRFIDPDGMSPDEWDYDVDSRKMTWVSDKGGNETQHVNIIKDGKQKGEASVSGDKVFAYKLRDNVLVTNTDKQFNDRTYNHKSNYEYTPTEFKKRDIYLRKKSPITTALLGSESKGKAMPLTYSQEEALYGYTVMRLRMMINAYDLGWSSPIKSPGLRRAPKLGSLSGNLSSKGSLTGYTGAKAVTGRNSWNLFLKTNKGVYSGQGWQKRAAADYFKSNFYTK